MCTLHFLERHNRRTRSCRAKNDQSGVACTGSIRTCIYVEGPHGGWRSCRSPRYVTAKTGLADTRKQHNARNTNSELYIALRPTSPFFGSIFPEVHSWISSSARYGTAMIIFSRFVFGVLCCVGRVWDKYSFCENMVPDTFVAKIFSVPSERFGWKYDFEVNDKLLRYDTFKFFRNSLIISMF